MGEVAGFTGRHRDRLPLQRDQPPGIGGQVAQAQQPGPLGMGHHPRQGLLEILRQQGIEMVEVEFVASGHTHQARGRSQAQRRRQGAAQLRQSPWASTSSRFSSPQTGQRRR